MNKRKSIIAVLAIISAVSFYSSAGLAAEKVPPSPPDGKKQERKTSNDESSDSRSTPRSTSDTDTASSKSDESTDNEKPGILARIFKFRRKSSHSAPDRLGEANNSPPPRPDPVAPRVIAPVVVHGSLCTLIMPATVRVGGFLRAEEGTRVTLMEAENVRPGNFIVRNGEEQGILMETALNLDRHTGNLYLEAADILVAHPELLARLLLEHPVRTQIVDVLAARRVLHLGLQRLFELELRETFQRGLATEIFRGATPAAILAGAIFNMPGALHDFRTNFIRFAIARIQEDYNPNDPMSLAIVLEQCIDYLTSLPNEAIPPELVLILKSLKNVVTVDNSSSPVSVLLGSMLFLRFICPALAQPDAWLPGPTLAAPRIPSAIKEALRNLAKALQLIANQIDPPEEHPFFEILPRLRRLHRPVEDFLNRIAQRPMPLLLVEPSLIARAATIYGLMMRMGREGIDPDLQLDLDALEARLGRPPEGRVENDAEAPMNDEINRIVEIITSNCVSSRFLGM